MKTKLNVNLKNFFWFTILILFCESSYAEINRNVVSRAWKRISNAAYFPELTVNYESDNEPNAWIMFRGENDYSLHVTKGLMRVLMTEDEIAGVLAHETGHVKLGHYNDMILSDTVREIMSTNLEHTDILAQASGKIEMELREKKFDREQETEADNYGTDLLIKAGYNSMGLYNALKRIDSYGYMSDGNDAFDSHPAIRERLNNLLTRARIIQRDREDNREDNGELDEIISVMMGSK